MRPSPSPSRFRRLQPSAAFSSRISSSLLCMAANSKVRAITGGFGKQLVNQIWAAPRPSSLGVASPASISSRFGWKRGVHVTTIYDKNEEEQVRVPDHVIGAKAEKYWGPHPKTGVFSPAGETGASATASGGAESSAAVESSASAPSALDQAVWYRPAEDVDKEPQA